MADRILVTGATGLQGGAVARHLLKLGKAEVRCLTRHPDSEAAKTFKQLGAAHHGNTLRNAQWLSRPTKTGEDGYGDAGVSRDTGDWSDDLASQGYSVPEVPWRVLKLPQRLFEVGEWIDLIGVALRSIR